MIISIIGDALKVDANILAHQTNCVGVMGAGIARQIKEKLLTRQMFYAYRDMCNKYNADLLGHVQFLQVGENRYVANVFGENKPTGRKLDTDYESLRKGLNQVHEVAKKNGMSVVIPGLMGCGLAGGDWHYVLHNIVEPIFANSEVKLTIAYFLKQDYDKYVTSGPNCQNKC